MLKFYTSEKIECESKIIHGFFTRLGGTSSGIFSGLNCGIGSGDDPEIVSLNRKMVADEVGVSTDKLIGLYQVHSNIVHDVTYDRPEGDAFVTDQAGVALSVLTADCAPVLFVGCKDNGEPVIGAAHAGSKGALSGVLDNVVYRMKEKGCALDSVSACIGPCISKNSYEVGASFIEPFLTHNDGAERFFHPASKEGHALFDLSAYCAWRLFQAGVKNTIMMDIDTYKNEEEFYSYRRSTHRNEKQYGRQISVIMIKDKENRDA